MLPLLEPAVDRVEAAVDCCELWAQEFDQLRLLGGGHGLCLPNGSSSSSVFRRRQTSPRPEGRAGGDVVGWYTLPVSGTVCSTSSISTAARQAASAAGVNLSAYTRYVYVFPQNVCTWAGWGSIGGHPSEAWINGSLGLRLVAHELGHNFGFYHSHNFECGTTALGASCTVSDYGDTMDIMGSAFTAHYNAVQKERLGWLNYSGSPPLLTVTGSGTFTIEPYETRTTNPKELKLLRSVDAATGRATWY